MMSILGASLAVLLLQADGDEKIKASATPFTVNPTYRAQMLGELDRPVGDGFTVAGTKHEVQVDDRGRVKVDIRGDKRFRQLSGKQQIQSFSVKAPGSRAKSVTLKMLFQKDEKDTWTYRNVTALRLKLGKEEFVVVDANNDGVYNSPGVDGLGWAAETALFPLPAPEERWCSETMNYTGLKFGPLGGDAEVSGRPLTTTVAAALDVLKGVNQERAHIGLTPRPEDPTLSAQLQKHCNYMAQNNTLTHPEDPKKPGYTKEGNAAGMRSILSMGSPAPNVARGMVLTYFHRQDVIRPDAIAFGVGYQGRYGGIDGRSGMMKKYEGKWPVLYPAPGQEGCGTRYGREAPDACPGDSSAGLPITAYFGARKLKLTGHALKSIGPATPSRRPAAPAEVDCYLYDPQTGASSNMTGYQRAVCIIPKDPLASNTRYEVTLEVDVNGTPWKRTWQFSTGADGGRSFRRP